MDVACLLVVSPSSGAGEVGMGGTSIPPHERIFSLSPTTVVLGGAATVEEEGNRDGVWTRGARQRTNCDEAETHEKVDPKVGRVHVATKRMWSRLRGNAGRRLWRMACEAKEFSSESSSVVEKKYEKGIKYPRGDLRSSSGAGTGDGIENHTDKWLSGGKAPIQWIAEAAPVRNHRRCLEAYTTCEPWKRRETSTVRGFSAPLV